MSVHPCLNFTMPCFQRVFQQIFFLINLCEVLLLQFIRFTLRWYAIKNLHLTNIRNCWRITLAIILLLLLLLLISKCLKNLRNATFGLKWNWYFSRGIRLFKFSLWSLCCRNYGSRSCGKVIILGGNLSWCKVNLWLSWLIVLLGSKI